MISRGDTHKLIIPYLGDTLLSDNQGIDDKIKKFGVLIPVDKINWIEYPFKPEVRLFAVYSDQHLWISFEVRGDHFRAKARADQEAVWEDSCVEFFFSRGGEDNCASDADVVYRNFEFNVLGVCLSAIGTKSERVKLSPGEMDQILRFPTIDSNKLPSEGAYFDWNLSVAIPLNLLGIRAGSTFTANFYKCGDLTSRPHFLSWSSINATNPDFHLPQFFGRVELGES